MSKNSWTQEQLDILVKNWHKMSNAEIGKMIGKTGDMVKNKAQSYITFDMMNGRHYSKYEDELLRKLYGTMSMEDLSNRMKRTPLSLERRIRIVEGCSDFMSLQDVYNTEDIAGFLGISKSILTRRIAKSNMPFYRVNKKYVIKHDEFWNWLNSNLHKANFNNITTEYELLAPKWYSDIIIRKKRELRNIKSFTKWTSREEALLWSEMMKGTPYKVIAEMLGRGKNGIAKKAVELMKRKMKNVS